MKGGASGEEIRDPAFDPCLLLDEQMDVLMEEKHGFTAAFGQLTFELLTFWTTSRGLRSIVMS